MTLSEQSLIPARLDRLPWSRFHTLVLSALGVIWVLDGLEVTIVGAIGGILQDKQSLDLTASEIGAVGSAYVSGAVLGAIFFAYLSDRIGRTKLFTITLAIYLTGVILSAFSWDTVSFAVFRLVTGIGVGGEYTAVNSAVDELVPGRLRGQIDLLLNSSYWAGAAIASASTLVILNPDIIAIDLGWRLGFVIGGVLCCVALYIRRYLPESPRWLLVHGQIEAAEHATEQIENQVRRTTPNHQLPEVTGPPLVVYPRKHFEFHLMLQRVLRSGKKRSAVAVSLMIAQAFLYNAVIFTYALVLTKYFDIPSSSTGIYFLPFAIGNFLGSTILGRLFDKLGRRPMISGTFAASGIVLAVTGYFFQAGYFSAVSLTAMWTLIFFFASAAAGSAFLTVSETFALESRSMAIAIFYCIGTGFGGIAAPWLFGHLIDTGSRLHLFYGYLLASTLMLIAAVAEFAWGVETKGKSLESIVAPLSSNH